MIVIFRGGAPRALPARIKPLRLFTEQRSIFHQPKPRSRWLAAAGAALGGSLAAFIVYDGALHEFTYTGAALRFSRSLRAAAFCASDYFRVQQHELADDYDVQLQLTHQKCANRLLETCLLNGGLYIKVGQGVAAINHILPKEYTSTLSALQDKCLPTTKADVRKVFKEEFGAKPEEIFAEFDYTPVAAASLAQVFKAKLKTGEQVAVKVQYSDLRKRFTSDLGTIIFLQHIIEVFFKNYNFGWILRDLRKNLVQELNFIHEAKNAERCAMHLKKFNFVHVPGVYWDFTKKRVLTLEWMDGFKISDVEEIKRRKMNLKDIDVKLFTMFSEQIFSTGFVHADPHAGNIFLRENPKTGQAELVLLDHGLYEELSDAIRVPLCEFWEATVLRDDVKMAAAAKKLKIRDHVKFAEVLFQQPIRVNAGHIKTKLTDDDIVYMQHIARRNFDLIMNTLREMPRNMLFVVRNLNTIRAIGRHHGDVVDRPRVMARYAQRCIYTDTNNFLGYFRWLYRRLKFEYGLWSSSFKMSLVSLYLNVLVKLGRAPEAARHILEDMAEQEY